MAPQTLPAQNVPAWKRLGLKLKRPTGDATSTPTAKPATASNGTTAASSSSGLANSTSGGNKRKEYPSTASNLANKKVRTDFGQSAQTPSRRKSVTFADGTKGSDPDSSATKNPSKPPGAADSEAKKKKRSNPKGSQPPKKPEQNFKPSHLQPQVSQYLRDWHTARDTWKFRKNIQTILIKYAFDPELLPAADFPVFCKYASGVQGASRGWLRNSALERRKKDIEQKGAAGFPEGTVDVEAKQKKYEELVAKMLGPQGSQPRPQSNSGGGDASRSNGKRVRDDYSEDDLVMGGTDAEARDPEVTQRLVKRMRAEMVLDKLSDADASDATTTTTTTAGSSTEGASTATPSAEELTEKKLKLNDGSQKRRRQRKKRTAGDDDISSSDESSDSNDDNDAGSAEDEDEEEEDDDDGGDSDNESTSSSGTSSSGSDSDSSDGSQSEGTLMRLAQEREALDTSSSSSSSSSSSGSSASGSESESDADTEL